MSKPADTLHSCSTPPDSLYRFPWNSDEQWNLVRGNWDDPNPNKHDTVDGGPQSYSYDFVPPDGQEGHPIRAARGGRVAFVHSTQAENVWGKEPGDPGFPPGARGEGNIVVIRHLDGTAATYCHLQKNQVFVEKDEYVARGRVIARMGNTGNSGGPHLHFDSHPSFTNWDAWVDTMKIRFEDKNHDCYRPHVGDVMSSNNRVTAEKFSCLLGPRQGQHSSVAGMGFDEFVAAWVYLGDPPANPDGSKPPKSDMASFSMHQEGGKMRFNGIFGPGKGGGQQFVAGMSFTDFTALWVELGSKPTNKKDMITFTTYVENGARKFAGLFGPGKGGQSFVAGKDFEGFSKLWVDLGSKPTNKSDMITFTTYLEGGARKFAGLFGPGKGGQTFVSGMSFQAFCDLWVELGSRPTNKSDMIAFDTYVQDGVRKFAGLFGPGSGGQQFVVDVTYDEAMKLWATSRKSGLHLLQIVPH